MYVFSILMIVSQVDWKLLSGLIFIFVNFFLNFSMEDKESNQTMISTMDMAGWVTLSILKQGALGVSPVSFG